MTSRVSWAALVVVLLGALWIGVAGDRAPTTESGRVKEIAAEIRCPTCAGLSAAESDAAAAQAVRDEIRTRLRAGQDQAQIEEYFVGRFGPSILLRPEGTGVAGLVWALPVAAGLAAGAGLVFAFRRWRRERELLGGPTEEDRLIVARALEEDSR